MASQGSHSDQVLSPADGPPLLGSLRPKVWFEVGRWGSLCKWKAVGGGEPYWIILGSCAGWELGSAFQGAPYCLWTMRASWPPGISLLSCRAGERPELCRMSLPEFQQFLLEYQAVCWAGLGLGQGSQLKGAGLITDWSLSCAPPCPPPSGAVGCRPTPGAGVHARLPPRPLERD